MHYKKDALDPVENKTLLDGSMSDFEPIDRRPKHYKTWLLISVTFNVLLAGFLSLLGVVEHQIVLSVSSYESGFETDLGMKPCGH